jgi:predicted CXXCH cytochrome family protein
MRVKPGSVLLALCLPGAVAIAIGASCGDDRSPPTTPERIARPAPDARLIVLTDMKGYLEPCGCTSRPLGGIDRMAAKVAELRRGVSRTVVVAAGDLFFGPESHPSGIDPTRASSQEIWKAETLVDALERIGLDAATMGREDFSFGPQVFGDLAVRADFPLLAGGLEFARDGANLLEEKKIVDAGEFQIGLFGVTDPSRDGAFPEGATRREEPAAAATRLARELTDAGADVIVVLVRGDRRLARRIASETPGVDFVVQGGIDRAEVITPSAVDSAFLLHAGNQGQGLVSVDLYLRNGGAFTDWSDWTVDEERSHQERQIEERRALIAEWERGNAAASDLDRQRRELGEMERELARMRLPARVEGNAFNASYFELPFDAPRQAAITRMMTDYDRRVNSHNREVFADLVPPAPSPGQAHYVGSASCQSCHESAYRWWSGHPHGLAYRTLTERSKEFNLSCVGCHVTGYMRPGGSTVTHNLDGALVNVGCESCHGPGSAHVASAEAPNLIARDTPESVCVGCHNQEHSDHFVYEAYRAMILVPGHGRPDTGG